MDLDELITSLNRSLAGWANYFRYGVSKAVFSAVDHHAWGRLMRWIRAKYAGKHRLGMKELRRRFCDQGWRFACNGVVLHRRIQRRRDPVPLPRQHHRDPMDPETSSRRHRRLTSGKDTGSARCGESRTPGAGGGSRETTGGNTGTAPAGLPHHLLDDPAARYRDLGPDWHARHTDRSRKARNARRQLEALGYDVIITLREDAA